MFLARHTLPRCVLVALLLGGVTGCRANFPVGFDGGTLPPRPQNPRFGDIATCLPPLPQLPTPTCPGPNCPNNVVAPNEPDGAGVDLAACTLDVVFSRGTIITPEIVVDGGVGGLPDVVFHLGASVGGSARIEGSQSGAGTFVALGFINAPTGIPTDPRCVARCADRTCSPGNEACADGSTCPPAGYCFTSACKARGLAVLDLSAAAGSSGCNTLDNLNHVRLSHFTGPGSVSIDAVEALARAFRPQQTAP